MNMKIKLIMIKTISLLITAAMLLTVMSGCGSVSLLKREESTTKAAFDDESFKAEYGELESETSQTEASTDDDTEPESEESSSETTGEASTKKEDKATTTEKQTSEKAAREAASTLSATVKRVTTTLRSVVDQKISTKETKSKYKYGVVKINVVSTYYDVYSDGTKEKTDTKEYTKYDYSDFEASTSDLLDEAKTDKSTYSSMINAAADTLNSARSAAGVSELTLDDSLCTAACVRAAEMAYSGTIGSKRPDGSSCYTVLDDLDIESKSEFELTCKGYTGGAEAVDALKAKKANATQMTSETYTKVGVGAASNPEGIMYFCIIFIK